MSESRTANPRHPIFRTDSLYGRVTEGSLWHDDGVMKIQEFFEALRCEELRREWTESVPEQPQDWGMGEEFDLAYHEFLLAGARQTPNEAEILNPSPDVLAGARLRGAGKNDVPIAAIFDLRGGECHVIRDEAPGLFPGTSQFAPGATTQNCDVDIPLGEVHSKRPFDSTTFCRFLILRPHLIGLLAEMIDEDIKRFGPEGDLQDGVETLNGSDLRDHDQSIATVKRLVTDHSLLAPPRDDETAYRRAFWLSAMLGLATGLQGRPEFDRRTARFQKRVPLKKESPVLEGVTLGALFIGP